jgi:hypothetical protein
VKVAYLVHFRGGRETGVFRKVAEHAEEWACQGATVGLFVGTSVEGLADWESLPTAVQVRALPPHPAATVVARERLAAAIRRWAPDVLYARHGLVYPGLLWTARRIPTVLEINADDVAEFGATSPLRQRYSRATRDLLLGSARGLVFVTNELAASPRFRRGPGRRAVIANGIRLADYPPYAIPRNERPRLVFIGHPRSPWHGLEHVLELGAAFPGWDVDVIGPGPDELTNPPANVHAHGTMTGDAYRPILARADVAVGTLALYRKGMEEASPLKVREYLARGIPTIVGYRDTDFGGPTPFLLQIANRPNGVLASLEAIESFVTQAIGTRVPPDAIGHLDTGPKEERRLALLREVVRP